MTPLLFLLGLAIGVVFGYVAMSWWERRKSEKYLSVTEYWVFLPGESLPAQDEVMKLVLKGNSPIGPQEGLLLSDIRLHVALILRSRNPGIFRPDLFEDYIEPTAELLSSMSQCNAVVKIRYLSEVRLQSDAHLQLLPYLAYAYAKLGQGKVVYDVTAERLMTVEDLVSNLKENADARRPEFHINTIWRRTDNGGRAETRGLAKKGMPELYTLDVEVDERLLVTGLVEEAGKNLWKAESLPTEVDVESFNDTFRLLLSPPREGRSQVRIMRVQSV
jgi:hypothetical protein